LLITRPESGMTGPTNDRDAGPKAAAGGVPSLEESIEPNAA
jgi:hypothetical protein